MVNEGVPMNIVRVLILAFTRGGTRQNSDRAEEFRMESYDSPMVVDLGRSRDLVLGNSSSGKADANSQYYW
jgi:hypothetical protein